MFNLQIRFNPWKHHLHWIITQVLSSRNDTSSQKELISRVAGLNNNYIDLYTGIYKPNEIVQQIEALIRKDFTDLAEYYYRFNKSYYELITLNDQSVWVLRRGNSEEPCIHIHPAKNTPHSIRIYGTLLKVSILLILFNKDDTPQLAEINDVRVNYLALSPLKKSYATDKITRTTAILRNWIINRL